MPRHTVFISCWLCWTAFAGGAMAGEAPVTLFARDQGPASSAGWKAYCEEPQADPNSIWEWREEVLVLKAGPRGYVRTEEDFGDFRLSLQWRRPADNKPGRAGVLIRMTGQDKIWPKSLEAQLNAGGAGDFWGLVGFGLSGPATRLQQVPHDQFGPLTHLARTLDAEKPPGQWNQYEIIAVGEQVTLKINGQEVNRATRCDTSPGKICLTAEGDEIHFRNVRLTPTGDQNQQDRDRR